MTACFLKSPMSIKNIKKEAQKVLSQDMTARCRLVLKELIKDHSDIKNAFKRLSGVVGWCDGAG